MENAQHTLVIGAGLAGLACARRLATDGQRVTVLDKGRTPGGRLCTRVSRSGPTFDQGAQFFTARSVTFQNQVRAWVDAGDAAVWDGRVVDLESGKPPQDTSRAAQRYVGTPGMSRLLESLADEVRATGGTVDFGKRVLGLDRTDAGWEARLESGETLIDFAEVVLAIPAPQAIELLQGHSPALCDELDAVEIEGSWTLMIAFAPPLKLREPFVAAFVQGHGLSQIIHNSSKPGRPHAAESGDCWVIHADNAWSAEHLEDKPEQVAAMLTAAFGQAVHQTLPEVTYAAVHRWRYGHITAPLRERWLLDAAAGLAVCGDQCSDGSPANIERAFLSGLALGEHVATR